MSLVTHRVTKDMDPRRRNPASLVAQRATKDNGLVPVATDRG